MAKYFKRTGGKSRSDGPYLSEGEPVHRVTATDDCVAVDFANRTLHLTRRDWDFISHSVAVQDKRAGRGRA